MLKKSIPCGARGHLRACAKRNMHSAKRKERGGRTNEIDFCTLVCVYILWGNPLIHGARIKTHGSRRARQTLRRAAFNLLQICFAQRFACKFRHHMGRNPAVSTEVRIWLWRQLLPFQKTLELEKGGYKASKTLPFDILKKTLLLLHVYHFRQNWDKNVWRHLIVAKNKFHDRQRSTIKRDDRQSKAAHAKTRGIRSHWRGEMKKRIHQVAFRTVINFNYTQVALMLIQLSSPLLWFKYAEY